MNAFSNLNRVTTNQFRAHNQEIHLVGYPLKNIEHNAM